jgi:hypothetical protein
MTAAWLEPPAGLAEPALPGAQDAFGFDLVALLDQDDPRAGLAADLAVPAGYGDALYAWAVGCYEAGRHREAGVILRHLCSLQPNALRNLKACAANHLARGDLLACAATYGAAHALAEASAQPDAEILFFWGQTEWLLGRQADAAQHLRQAQALACAQPTRLPGLAGWCTELLDRLAPAPSPPSPAPGAVDPSAAPSAPVSLAA